MSGGSCERGNAVREPPVKCEVSTPKRCPIEQMPNGQERMQKEPATSLRRSLCRRLFVDGTQQEDSDEEDSKRSFKLRSWKKKKKKEKEKSHWSPPKREWADAYMSPPSHEKRALRKRMKRLNQDESTLTPQRRCSDEYQELPARNPWITDRPPPVARLRGFNVFSNQKKKARGWMWAPSESTESTTSSPPSTVPVEERVDVTPRSGRRRRLLDPDDSDLSESEDSVWARVANPPWMAENPLMEGRPWDSPESSPGSLFYTGRCPEDVVRVHTPSSPVYSERYSPKHPSLRNWKRTPNRIRRDDTMSASNYTNSLDYHTPLASKPYLDRVPCTGTDSATPKGSNGRQRAMEMYFDPNVRSRAATPRQPRPSRGFFQKLTDFVPSISDITGVVPSISDIAAVPCTKALNLLDKYYSSGTQPYKPPER